MASLSAIDFPHLLWTNETFGEGIHLQGLAVLLNYFLFLINSHLPLAHATHPSCPPWPIRVTSSCQIHLLQALPHCSPELPSLRTKAPGTRQSGLNYVLLVSLANCHFYDSLGSLGDTAF